MQAFLGQKSRAQLRALLPTLGLAVGALLSVGACGNTNDSSDVGGAGAGTSAGASAGEAHSAGAGGAPVTSSAGRAGAADEVAGAADAGASADAGAAGVPAGGGGTSGSGTGGSAGAPTQSVTCTAGGSLFATGNYADAQGNELWLRTNAHASTLAWIAQGPAKVANPPQILVVERVCAAGGALLAKAASAVYRIDFSFAGNQLALCKSAAVPSLEAALALPPADWAHAADTGCSGQPFSVFVTQVTP